MKKGSVLVVGGGIAGIQAALDSADGGFKVYLVEKSPSIGGRTAQLDKTFPTMDCSICILAPKMIECYRHPNIELLTYSEVEKVSGSPGAFKVTVRRKPRYVDEENCTGCGDCTKECPIQMLSEFNMNLATRNAIYRPFPQAVPNVFTIDKKGIAPCRDACPAGVNIPAYVTLTAQGKFDKALEVIRRNNPLPAVCGRVCFHPCEQECGRGDIDQPVAINPIKRFLTDYERATKRKAENAPITREEKIAVIGAGPAGLAAAHQLVKKGYATTIFESLPEAGGMLRITLPRYRLPEDILDADISYITDTGVEIRTNTVVGKDITIDELLNDGYQAVFVATGAGKSRRLHVEGEDLNGVVDALDLLTKASLGGEVGLGKRVAIIGGGNVAIDAARAALRLGAEKVTILYRRSRKEMPASAEEVKEAEKEGVEIRFLVAPKRILGKAGKVSGLECVRMELGPPDETGRRSPIPTKGSEHEISVDTVVPAVGEIPDLSFLPDDIKTTERGTVDVDPVTLQTSRPQIFAGGDAVSGPATVIDAIAAGNRAAVSVDRYLRGEDLKSGREDEPTLRIIDRSELPKEAKERKKRHAMPCLPIERRLAGFDEVALGFTEEMAVEEAKRCLMCAGCCECLECEKLCQAKAIVHNQKEELLEIEVGAIILATGFAAYDPSEIKEYGYGLYPNVISSIEFERILSPTGPYGGTVMRPYDRETPRKIAFIQCVGSRDAKVGNEYCSAVCCMYAMKEAVIAKEHNPDLHFSIFFMDMRAYGKEFEQYYVKAEKEHKIRFVRCRASRIEEVPESRNLLLKYVEDGQPREEEFGLVVLSVGMQPPRGTQELADKLGVELNKNNFCSTKTFSPLETSRPGIYVCGAFASPKDIPDSVAQASGAAAMASTAISSERGTLVSVKEYPSERDVADEEVRVGAFICHCGINIGGVVDVPSVVDYTKKLPNVVYAEANLYTCSQDSQERIKEKVREHRLNRVVVASCTPRTHEPLFRESIREAGLNPYLFEMANIRDQCSWVHMHEPEKATDKAKDLLRAAVAKARLLRPLKKPTVDVTPVGLVIGGGLSGMTAALELAGQGFHVHLVERENELGGNLRKIHYTLEGEDPQEQLRSLIQKTKQNHKVHVHTGAEITDIAGYIGNFETTLAHDGEDKKIKHGVVIVATGGIEYKPSEYLYGIDDRVMTQSELEEKLARDQFNAGTVVMIQCVGSRSDERPYCSRICCTDAIKNALRIKELNPAAEVYMLYKDIRTYGFRENYYHEALRRGVVFIRYDDDNKPLVDNKNGLRVFVSDPILKKRLLIEPEALVLSVGVLAQPESERIARMLKVPLSKDGFFLEAHMKLRPVDFASDGIFLCGMAHSPKFIDESISQAHGAAARAITILSNKTFEVEGNVATVDQDLCSGCRICESLCEYAAIEMEEKEGKSRAKVIEALCKGCGVCGSSCPTGSITMLHFTDDQILSQVRATLREEVAA